jgi:pyrroloquinoline quinone (PQQ) biosynthesis protein C
VVTIRENSKLISTLKQNVEEHEVLKHPWLLKRKNFIELKDLHTWLSQEYFVSVDFVNWFLLASVQATNLEAKIVLVQNIWEELGEGKLENSHVKILEEFLNQIQFNFNNLKLFSGTEKYLQRMKEIIEMGFLESLGALGPANEYLLKLEYGTIAQSYNALKQKLNLPEAKFFQVNLNADESHSKKIFELIEKIAISPEQQQRVIRGNLLALEARILFYEGLPQ